MTVLAVVVVALVGAGIAVVLTRDTAKPTVAISGTMTVKHDTIGRAQRSSVTAARDGAAVGKNCSTFFTGTGYEDIRRGAAVTVRDERGTTIATGALADGQFVAGGCEFSFRIADVPEAKFYKVEVSHRGELEFSHEELKAAEWTVTASLG